MITEVVPPALAGERVDRVVSFVTGCSRSEAAGLIAAGGVRHNGIPVRKGADRVGTGDVVEIDDSKLPDEPRPHPDPTVPVSVLHVDDAVIVVDKAAGVVVHPGAGTPDGTLVSGLLARYPDLASVGDPVRPGVVHRLDKGTSGVLVVARTDDAHASLSAQLRERTVERRYVALVHGHVEADHGVIDARLGRSRRHPAKQAVLADGREARTHYEVVGRFTEPLPVTRVDCRLETGRTHQIRVHLSAIGHPVVGDVTYGGEAGALGLSRPALHAAVLGFEHPGTGAPMRFESEIPADLAAAIARLA